jgi:hypothetical protein
LNKSDWLKIKHSDLAIKCEYLVWVDEASTYLFEHFCLKRKKLTENSHKCEDWNFQASVVDVLEQNTEHITLTDSNSIKLKFHARKKFNVQPL